MAKPTIRHGGKRNDRFISDNNPGRLFGLAGNDLLQRAGSKDILNGETKNDTLDDG